MARRRGDRTDANRVVDRLLVLLLDGDGDRRRDRCSVDRRTSSPARRSEGSALAAWSMMKKTSSTMLMSMSGIMSTSSSSSPACGEAVGDSGSGSSAAGSAAAPWRQSHRLAQRRYGLGGCRSRQEVGEQSCSATCAQAIVRRGRADHVGRRQPALLHPVGDDVVRHALVDGVRDQRTRRRRPWEALVSRSRPLPIPRQAEGVPRRRSLPAGPGGGSRPSTRPRPRPRPRRGRAPGRAASGPSCSW